MNWLGERPRPLHEAWNILCDAVQERIDAFGVKKYSTESWRQPSAPSKRTFYIPGIRDAIRHLYEYTFSPRLFNTWWCDTGSHLNKKSLELENLDIDAGAFFSEPSNGVPSYKHSISEFIYAAARILNDFILYPLPLFEKWSGVGFLIDADLTAEEHDYDDVFVPLWKGKYSIDGYKEFRYFVREVYVGENKYEYVIARPNTVVQNSLTFARCKSTNIKIKYYRSGDYMELRDFVLPELIGIGKARLTAPHFSIRTPEENYRSAIPDPEYDIDFSTGEATRIINTSGIKSRINEFWDMWSNDADKWYYEDQRYIITFDDNIEIYLTKDNFPELNYKYWSGK